MHHPRSGKATTRIDLSSEALLDPGGPHDMRYDVTIMGEPGDLLRSAFSDVAVRRVPGMTVLSADLDQAALHGLLGRVADFGIELVGVQRVAGSA
jgi:hypothetical protein